MAKIKKTSKSKFHSELINTPAKSNWPKDYFKNFGALSDISYPPKDRLKFPDETKVVIKNVKE